MMSRQRQDSKDRFFSWLGLWETDQLCSRRCFDNPPPSVSEEIVPKIVHSLLCCVRHLLNPLSSTVVRRGCVSFCTDVLKLLFHGKGYQEARRRMYSYDLVDFPSVCFPSD